MKSRERTSKSVLSRSMTAWSSSRPLSEVMGRQLLAWKPRPMAGCVSSPVTPCWLKWKTCSAVRRRRRHLTADFVSAFLQRLRSIAVVIERAPERFSYARDPDDEPYLNLAVEVGAEYLVSRDNDLLDLQKPDSKPGGDLRQLLPRLAILDPVEFLRILSPPPDAPPQLILKKQSLTTSKVNVLPAGLSLHVLTARRLQGIRFKRVIARTQMLRARRVGDTENIPDVRWIRLIRRIAEVS